MSRWARASLAAALAAFVGAACGGVESRDSGRISSDPKRKAALTAIVADTSGNLEARIRAAAELTTFRHGSIEIVARYGTAPDGFTGLLLSRLRQDHPELAARLAARVLASAAGEAKLEPAQILVGLKQMSTRPLIELLEEDIDWQTRVQALDVLGKLGPPEALSSIEDQMTHPNAWVRIAAAHALSGQDPSLAFPLLVLALDDSSSTVISAALIALGKSGDERATAACLPLLSHPNPRVRGAAVSALGRLGGPGVKAALRQLEKDEDDGVRYKVREALEALP